MAKKFMFVCFGILALVGAFAAGAITGQASLPYADIAVGSGPICHGVTLGLPYYSDGTQARQEECVWIVSPLYLSSGHNSTLGFECKTNPDMTLHFRQYTIEGSYYDSMAQYLIIAVRGGATSNQSSTWGQIKAQLKD